MMMMMNTTVIHNHQSLSWIINGSPISNSSPFLLSFNNNNNKKKKKTNFRCCCVSASPSQLTTISSHLDNKHKPSAGEMARTIMELSSVGTLSSVNSNNNQADDLSCVGVRFAVDPENGSPIVSLNPNIHHHSDNNITSTLNVQLEQCGGLRTTQCTIHGSLHTPTIPDHLKKLQTLWEKRFREKAESHFIHVLHVQRVLQLDNFTQDGVWISSDDYTLANPDPLRDCAHHLVHEINTHNREDVLRFCNIYVDSDIQVSDAKMVWVDRLGFDVHLYSPENEVFEVRIPFPREVTNEKGAKSAFNGMSQQAWEVEKNYHALEFQKATQLKKIASKLQ